MQPELKHRSPSETYNTFQRLHSVYFSHHRRTDTSPSVDKLPIKAKNRRLWEHLVPTIHAKEAVGYSVIDGKGQNDDDRSAMTSMDRLYDSRPTVLVSDAEIRAYIAQQSGRDRLNIMFTKMNDGRWHPSLEMVGTSACYCSAIVFLIMTYYSSRDAQEAFILANKATKFETKFLADRSFHDAVIKASLKVGFRYAAKAGIYTGVFLLSSQCISTYRNKTSAVEYVAAGGIAGMLFRINGGLRAMLASGLVSAVLGGVAGSAVWLAMYLGDETQDQRHYWYTEAVLKEKKEALMLAGMDEVKLI